MIFNADDLPVIRENIRKGFLETQSKVNTWVQNFKKKLDGEEEDENQPAAGYHPDSGNYNRPRRSGDMSRRSADRERYDADPQVISDDFSTLELRDSEGLLRSKFPRRFQMLTCLDSPSASSSTTARKPQSVQDLLSFSR
jgi:hypothetical protein